MSYRSAVILCGVVVVIQGFAVPVADACNTPVFRYAMYNWAPAPYEVFYFHRGPLAKEDEAANRKLNEMASALEATANVAVRTVDVAQPKQLDQVPEPVRQAWKTKHGQSAPSHSVWGPWGAEVFSGRLDAAAVGEMIDSPARTRVGELLKEGNAAVFLLLPGEKEPENQKAESAIKEVIARGASGRIPVAGEPEEPAVLPPGEPENKGKAESDAPSAPKGLKLALLKVSRSDPKERWLVRMLMAVEPDLSQFAAEPMVFAVYGRGRAMEPFVGKGITADNVTELAVFLAGACSCQVKDSNPGKDLLFHWDWSATADALAAAESGREDRRPLYEEIAVGGGDRPASAAPGKGPAAEESKPAAPAKPKTAPAAKPKDVPDARPEEAAVTPPGVQDKGPGAPVTGVSYAQRQMWQFGVGFAAVTVIVLLASFVLIRRQSGGP